jgi:predicted XRE-type DNA-binding protein
VSINRIATLFGVTRQRISALLREGPADGSAATDGTADAG